MSLAVLDLERSAVAAACLILAQRMQVFVGEVENGVTMMRTTLGFQLLDSSPTPWTLKVSEIAVTSSQ